jgi:hypothetical protein
VPVRVRKHTPTERNRFLDQLNGVLGGILAPESRVLSQSYYYGAVDGKAPVEVAVIPGRRLDLCDWLDAGAIGKGKRDRGTFTAEHKSRQAPEGLVESDDHPRLLAEGRRRILRAVDHEADTEASATGTRSYALINKLLDIRTGDGLILSAEAIHGLLTEFWPAETPFETVENAIAHRQNGRGCEEACFTYPDPPADKLTRDQAERTRASLFMSAADLAAGDFPPRSTFGISLS